MKVKQWFFELERNFNEMFKPLNGFDEAADTLVSKNAILISFIVSLLKHLLFIEQ